MLIFEINGRKATTLRAIKLLSHGLVDDHTVMQCVSRYGWPDVLPTLEPFRMIDGNIVDSPRGIFLTSYQRLEMAARTGDAQGASDAVPGGVLVWLDDAERVCRALEYEVGCGSTDAMHGIQWLGCWSENPIMTDSQARHALVGVPAAGVVAATSSAKLDANGNDPKLQQRAEEIAAELRQGGAARVPKKVIVGRLHDEQGINKETAMRRIKNTWNGQVVP